MTRDEIVALYARRQSAIDRRDAQALAALHAEDSVVESLMAGTVTGRGPIADVYEAWFKAFPDVVITREDDLIIEGDRVVLVTHLAGRDIGGFMGLPPTGRPFQMSIVHIATIRNGEIHHERRISDFTGLLLQIGALKARPA